MGYHRPVASFNIGKKGEHAERASSARPRAAAADRGPTPGARHGRRQDLHGAAVAPPALARRRARSVLDDRLPGQARRGGVLPGLPLALRLLPQPAPARRARRRRASTGPRVLALLDTRRGLLDGVVFTGGEPTAQAGSADAMRDGRAPWASSSACTPAASIRGGWPRCCRLVDWVGLDVKAPFADYAARHRRRAAAAPAAFASLDLRAARRRRATRCARRSIRC